MALYDLNDQSLLKISGPEAEKFLQGQLTCDITQLNASAHLGAHCDRKGRVQSLFYIFNHEDTFYLLLPTNILESTITLLKKYAVFFKVTLSAQPATCYAGEATELDDFIKIPMAHSELVFFINFSQKVISSHALPASKWHWRELQRGIPRLFPSTLGKFLPHELDLPNLHAVSFTKGCYTGQEIVARMEYRGKLKKELQLQTLTNTAELIPGNLLADPKNTIVDGVVTEKEVIALILSKIES
jgi:folate-binding protein YgfZ